MGKAPLLRAGHDDPLVLVVVLLDIEQHLAIGVRLFGEVRGVHVRRICLAVVPLAVAEEFHVGGGDRFARDSVGDVVIRLVHQRLLEDHRVGDPQHRAALVAAVDLGRDQVAAGLLQGDVTVIRLSKLFGRDSSGRSHCATFAPRYLSWPAWINRQPKSWMLTRCQSSCLGRVLRYSLTAISNGSTWISRASKWTFLALRKRKSTFAHGRRVARLTSQTGPTD